jgi:hypothetical protein
MVFTPDDSSCYEAAKRRKATAAVAALQSCVFFDSIFQTKKF